MACLGWFYKMERTGLEPVTPCLQSIYKGGECAQLAHSSGRDAHIFEHRVPKACNLRGNVSVIVSVLLDLRPSLRLPR